MVSVVGVDSRIFVRDPIKRDGSRGRFSSVLGAAIKIADYVSFKEKYDIALKTASKHLPCGDDLQILCYNDIKKYETYLPFLDAFFKEISPHIDKIHIFYTLFSRKKFAEAKAYGLFAKKNKLKLNKPTVTYDKLVSAHLVQCFPVICAWRLLDFLNPDTIEFHLDSYEGHICEAQKELDAAGCTVKVFPGGDCVNAVISVADLLIGLLDDRLKKENKLLIFENIRPALKEFGEKTLVYPISNKHLHWITPLDTEIVTVNNRLKHPVFWVFKGEEILDSNTLKHSKSYRNLQDYAASQFGVVKMFDKKDITYFKEGDYGVYLNTRGKEQIESCIKMGKKFLLFPLDRLVPNDLKR